MASVSSYFEYGERSFLGTWRVKKFEAFETADACSSSNDNEITGTEIIIEENNEVRWKTPADIEAIPLFSCESYEVILTNPAQLTFLSSTVGRIGPFAAEFDTSSELRLTYDKAFMLYCEKVPQSERIQEAPFSFLPALERGYFSDLVITSSTGKNFHAHKVIMWLGCPEQDWNTSQSTAKQMTSRSYQACVLDGLSNSVLNTVLHYLYCECLPPRLSEAEARECATAVSKLPGFVKLAKLCECYLDNYAVRKKIEHLCDEVESCCQNIRKLVETRLDAPDLRTSSAIQSEPEAVFQAMKQAVRVFIIALLKAIRLCKLFADHRTELSREERHTIMKHCRARLPNLLSLSSQLFEIISSYLARQTEETKRELATYFLAETEPMFDVANQLVLEIRQALEAIINSDSSNKHRQKESVITRTLKNAVHIKELAKLRRLHGEMVEFINNLMLKRDHFKLLSTGEKIEAMSNIIECATDEIPLAIDRIVNLNENLDNRLSWTRWKYFFKMITAKVAWIIEKSKHSKQSTANAIKTFRKLMHSEEFDADLAALGLMEHVERSSAQKRLIARNSQSQHVDSLSVPPVPRDSHLSACAEKLYTALDTSAEFADMKFIVHFEKDDEPCTQTIKAHRVIIACRCDWFRRALLSGMKEDIKREINVYDSNPDVFRQFLHYLYVGRLDCAHISIDILAEMVALSDRYEMDDLKCVCEGAIAPQISNDNVLELLSIGEQFNAASLRECCMEFILEHPDVLESSLFNELPPQLQVEVRELTDWNRRDQVKLAFPSSLSSHHRQHASPEAHAGDSLLEGNNDLSSEMEMIDQLTNALHLQHDSDSEFDDGSFEYFESPGHGASMDRDADLESCISALQEVLGDAVQREELSRISITANFDVNRALNFYFGSQN